MAHSVDIHVGQKVRQRRWLMGMTQQQLAAEVGIKFQQIQNYETGMNRVSASRLWDISRVLGVSPSYFFEGIDDQPVEGSEEELLKRKETLELLRTYYQIPEEQRKKLLSLAQALGQTQ